MILKVKALTKKFPGVTALNQVSFSMKKREIVGLVGANGAGKSTCMKCILGLSAPTGGEVMVKGRPLYPSPHVARRHMGYLPEGNPLPGALRVKEYLGFMASLKGFGSNQVNEVIDAMEIGDIRSRVIGHLSSGYRQRVGLASALIGWPPLIVLDEPARGLDPFQREMLTALLKRAAEKSAILISSHGLDELERVASRFCLLVDGALTHDGPLPEGEGTLREFFLGRGRP